MEQNQWKKLNFKVKKSEDQENHWTCITRSYDIDFCFFTLLHYSY